MLQPFVVNPHAYDKHVEFKRALKYVRTFLDVNKIPQVSQLITEAPSESKVGNKWREYGWYKFEDQTMFVNIKKSRHPVKTPGFAWTYTGFKADLTAPGILAHETGHHIHNVYSEIFGHKEFLKAIFTVRTQEQAISGYEPNSYETFAEMLRLFIMNPALLAAARPLRYEFITRVLRLNPPHNEGWRVVLTHAHPRLITAAENWINK